MTRHHLHRSQVLPRPRGEVFAFFEDAANLARITPDFLGFEIVTPSPIAMGAGTVIDYRIRLFGIPMRWRTEIELYERGERFVDRQVRGPYRLWHHTHGFRDVPGGTEMVDDVDYEIGFGPLGGIAHGLFVRRTLARIFDYRAEVVAGLFGGGSRNQGGRDQPSSSIEGCAGLEAGGSSY